MKNIKNVFVTSEDDYGIHELGVDSYENFLKVKKDLHFRSCGWYRGWCDMEGHENSLFLITAMD